MTTIDQIRVELAKLSPDLLFDNRREIEEALLDVAEAAWAYAMDDTPAVDHFKCLDDLIEALRKIPQKLEGE